MPFNVVAKFSILDVRSSTSYACKMHMCKSQKLWDLILVSTETYSEPSQRSKMVLFPKMVNG